MKKSAKKWIIGAVILAVVVCALTLPFLHLGEQQGDGNSGEVRLDGVVYRPGENGGMFVAGAIKESIAVQPVINGTPVWGVAAGALKNNKTTKTVSFGGAFEQFHFGAGAFEKSVVADLLDIPAVSTFGAGALRLMPELEQISVQKGDILYVSGGILYQREGTSVTLLKANTKITTLPSDYAKNVTRIASGAFDYSRVTVIDIPSSVAALEGSVFVSSDVRRIILRHKKTVMPADVIYPLTKELEVLVDAKDQAVFKDFFNGGAMFLRKYGLYMHPLSEGFNTSGRVHYADASHVSITGYTYTKNPDGKTINIDIGGGVRLNSVDAWYIL